MLQTYAVSFFLLLGVGTREANGLILPYKPPSAEVLQREGVTSQPAAAEARVFSLAAAPPSAAPPSTGNALDRTGWTAAADTFQSGEEPQKAIDGNTGSIWHSQWNPSTPLPHTITIDMKREYNVNGLTYLPRQDGSNGNIGQHRIYLSRDGTNFGSPVAFGTWLDDNTLKATPIQPTAARYVRIQALTEAGNRGPWTSAAEINVYAVGSFTTPTGRGKWGPTIDFPIVPVAAAVENDSGNVVVWSSFAPDKFVPGGGGKTATAIYNPTDGTVTQRLISNTGHDMFCPGISRDVNGQLVVTGGNDAAKTSIYNSNGDIWFSAANMQISRGYQSSATCSDGRIFAIGGSWSGGLGGKDGEIYSPSANAWSRLSGCPVAPMLTADAGGIFRQDNHAWLFGWKNGFVFQAGEFPSGSRIMFPSLKQLSGPSKALNWYGTSGSGSRSAAGNRAADGDSMCGNAIMFDAVAGKILTVGGSPNYSGSSATTAAHVITINAPNSTPSVTKVGSMTSNRIFHNSVVLPDGQVFVMGGQSVGNPFSDDGAQLTPEMFNPATNSFTQLAPNTVPRTYHSIAVLLMDGTVLSGGGGLCGDCSTNHFDAQIYTPQYLLNSDGSAAARPAISSISATNLVVGNTLTINTDSAINGVALIRFGSNTHSVDTDQRRIPLTPTSAGTNRYTVVIPSDPGIALPGYWMLFVLNSAGVPSVARSIQIKPS